MDTQEFTEKEIAAARRRAGKQLAKALEDSLIVPKRDGRLYAWGAGTMGAENAFFLYNRLGPEWASLHLGPGENNVVLEVFKTRKSKP